MTSDPLIAHPPTHPPNSSSVENTEEKSVDLAISPRHKDETACQRPKLRDAFREQARDEILRTLESILRRNGNLDFRIEDLAKESGVSVGTIYNLFSDRQTLLTEMMTRRRDEVIALMGNHLKTDLQAPFLLNLETFIRSMLTHFQANLPFLRLLVAEHKKLPEISRQIKFEIVKHLSLLIDNGKAQGLIRDVDSRIAAIFLLMSMRGFVEISVETQTQFSVDEVTKTILDVFLHGVASASPSVPSLASVPPLAAPLAAPILPSSETNEV